MGANSRIEWTDHTFQPLDRLSKGIPWLHELLRGVVGEAIRRGAVGTRRNAAAYERGELARADQVEQSGGAGRSPAAGVLRELGGRV